MSVTKVQSFGVKEFFNRYVTTREILCRMRLRVGRNPLIELVPKILEHGFGDKAQG